MKPIVFKSLISAAVLVVLIAVLALALHAAQQDKSAAAPQSACFVSAVTALDVYEGHATDAAKTGVVSQGERVEVLRVYGDAPEQWALIIRRYVAGQGAFQGWIPLTTATDGKTQVVAVLDDSALCHDVPIEYETVKP